MRKVFTVLLMVVALVAFAACASTGPPTDLTETAERVCTLYEKVRPEVVAYHDWATANWNERIELPNGGSVPLISDRQKEVLLELNGYLPSLDAVGRTTCTIQSATAVARASPAIDWKRALAIVAEVAITAAELKRDGVI